MNNLKDSVGAEMRMVQAENSDDDCLSRWFAVDDPFGLHARNAALFVKTVSNYDVKVIVSKKKGRAVNGRSIMNLLTLDIPRGEKFQVIVEGPEAAATLDALDHFFSGEANQSKQGGHPFPVFSMSLAAGLTQQGSALISA